MARNRFTQVDRTRLPLTEGDWVEVKKDLNTGEAKLLEMCGRSRPTLVGDQVIYPIDWSRHDLERAMVYLLDWSFRDKDDRPVALTMDSLKALNPEDFKEVNQAILDHIVARAAEKKLMREAELKAKVQPEPQPMPSENEQTTGSEARSS